MDYMILLIILLAFAVLITGFFNKQQVCPPTKVIYKYVPENQLDIQFDEQNFPSNIYKEMFLKSSPWIGGYYMGNGRTYIEPVKHSS